MQRYLVRAYAAADASGLRAFSDEDFELYELADAEKRFAPTPGSKLARGSLRNIALDLLLRGHSPCDEVLSATPETTPYVAFGTFEVVAPAIEYEGQVIRPSRFRGYKAVGMTSDEEVGSLQSELRRLVAIRLGGQ